MGTEQHSLPISLLGLPILSIMAAALAVVIPFFFLGIPSGHDFEFHMNSWMEAVNHWHQGIWWPSWAALAHYGYGEPRFVFYPPLSWMLGGLLGELLPWKIVPATYIWICLTSSGLSMFLVARKWFDRPGAIFVAVLYLANPYYMVVIFWRSAFAEFLAGAMLPLLLLLVLRLRENPEAAVIPLALLVAVAWLTNIPASVMLNYSLMLLIIVLAVKARSWRLLGYGVLAVFLGAALAAFYLAPAAYEQKWIDVGQVFSLGVRPWENFLFTKINDPDHNKFNLLVSLVATAEIILVATAGFVSLQKKKEPKMLWLILVIWAAAVSLLMFSFTLPAWKYFPRLIFVQLPWRWLLCLNVPLAILVTNAFRKWYLRALIFLGLIGIVMFVSHYVQPPWWDHAEDVSAILADQHNGTGHEGTDEYVPVDADAYEIDRSAPLVSASKSDVEIHIQKWDSESRLFTEQSREGETLTLRLFNYPAWKVKLNGRQVSTQTRDVTGQMIIPIPSGMNAVQLIFVRTPDRNVGVAISLIAVLFVIGMLWCNPSMRSNCFVPSGK